MDSADAKIFCEMAFKNSGYSSHTRRDVSAADIGKKLGLDEKTVRTRVRKMERSGFIKYYQAVPNLALFGLRSIGSFRFEALNLATKADVVAKFGEIPRLVEGFDYLGNSVGATFAGATSKEVDAAAGFLASRFELDRTAIGERVVKEPFAKLDGLDLQIMRELRYDARAKVKSVAQKLKVTPRMVEYRTSKLMSSGALFVRAVIDVQRQAGLVFFELEIAIEEEKHPAVVRRIREGYGERLWYFSTPTPGRLVASFFGFSLGEPEDMALSVRKMDGVKTCFPFVLKQAIEPQKPNWIDALIDRAIEGAGGQ